MWIVCFGFYEFYFLYYLQGSLLPLSPCQKPSSAFVLLSACSSNLVRIFLFLHSLRRFRKGNTVNNICSMHILQLQSRSDFLYFRMWSNYWVNCGLDSTLNVCLTCSLHFTIFPPFFIISFIWIIKYQLTHIVSKFTCNSSWKDFKACISKSAIFGARSVCFLTDHR